VQTAIGSLDDLQAILERVADTGDEWARELVPRVARRLDAEWVRLCGGMNRPQAEQCRAELRRRLDRIGRTRDRQSVMSEAAAGLRALAALRATIGAA
jgi:uncharacterized protein YmfQ (DUF2313 family)